MPVTPDNLRLLPGDTLWFCGRGFASRAIGLWTASVPQLLCGRLISHVGIVYDDGCKIRHCESTTLNDQATDERRRAIRGVQVNDPWQRIEGYSGRVYLGRFPERGRLTRRQSLKLAEYLGMMGTTSYDMFGALLAGTTWIKRIFAPDATSLFCSELVAMALMDCDVLPRTFNASTATPAWLARHLVSVGICEPLRRVK
ncbi:MAG: hypothetical protein KIS84_13400 [Dokdonella sp.]|nr:hypothetical protein [Dokdonella sp.]